MTTDHPQLGLTCEICNDRLNPEECAVDTDGQKWDVCKGDCARQLGIEEKAASRWPEPVRDPLPARHLTEQDIDDALLLCVQHSREPEDPKFDVVTFGALGAAQDALVECAEALRMEAQALSGRIQLSESFVASRVSEAITARRVARRVINGLRKWLPEVTYG